MLAHLKALHALLEAIPADNSALQKTVCNVLRTGLRAYIESVDPKALVASKESKVRGAPRVGWPDVLELGVGLGGLGGEWIAARSMSISAAWSLPRTQRPGA